MLTLTVCLPSSSPCFSSSCSRTIFYWQVVNSRCECKQQNNKSKLQRILKHHQAMLGSLICIRAYVADLLTFWINALWQGYTPLNCMWSPFCSKAVTWLVEPRIYLTVACRSSLLHTLRNLKIIRTVSQSHAGLPKGQMPSRINPSRATVIPRVELTARIKTPSHHAN